MVHFNDLNLRIGEIKGVKDHPNADKLYILLVDLGPIEQDLQLVAGVKISYDKDELVGKKIVVVRNLEPAVLRGVESKGMLLAAVDGKNISLLIADKSDPGHKVFVERFKEKAVKEISFEDFKKIKITTQDNKAVFGGKVLRTESEEIKLDKKMKDGCAVS